MHIIIHFISVNITSEYIVMILWILTELILLEISVHLIKVDMIIHLFSNCYTIRAVYPILSIYDYSIQQWLERMDDQFFVSNPNN